VDATTLKKRTRRIQRDDSKILKAGGSRPLVEAIFDPQGPTLTPEMGLTPAECEFAHEVGRPLLQDLQKGDADAVDRALDLLQWAQPSHWVCGFMMQALRGLKKIPFSNPQRDRLRLLVSQLWQPYPSSHCKAVNVELRRALIAVADPAFVARLVEWSRRGNEIEQKESRRLLEVLQQQRPDLMGNLP
jgi:hypothetical protein